MKKYLGTAINVYCAIVLPLICAGCLALGIVIISSSVSTGAIAMFVFFIFSFAFFVYYAYTVSNQMYAWGIFKDDSVEVRIPLQKKYLIEYSKCVDVGIGYYKHGVLNSPLGSQFYYIYLSYDTVNDKYKDKINMVKPSTTLVKVGYTQQMYEYLVSVLPPKQKNMLAAAKRDIDITWKGVKIN